MRRSLLLLTALISSTSLLAQPTNFEQSSDQTTVLNVSKEGLVEMVSTNAVATGEFPWQVDASVNGDFPWQVNGDWPWQGAINQRVEVAAAQLYWLAPSSQERTVQNGVYAELRGSASVSNARIRLNGDFASMYPSLGEFLWQGPVTITPMANQVQTKQLFDIGCAGGYLIVNRVNVGRRTRFSPYVFENMMFWCESGDRLGSAVRYQVP